MLYLTRKNIGINPKKFSGISLPVCRAGELFAMPKNIER
jgi:hypothetical protein